MRVRTEESSHFFVDMASLENAGKILVCYAYRGVCLAVFQQGNAKEGYTYGQHHPKVRFDDSILYRGTAAYTYMALRWLAEHQ